MGHRQNRINKLLGLGHVTRGSVTAAPLRSLSAVQQDLARARSQLPPAGSQDVNLWGLLQKHNFAHQCTSVLGSSSTVQHGYLPKMEPRAAEDTGRQIINNRVQLCSFTGTIWIPFLTFSEEDRYLHCSRSHKNPMLPEKAPPQKKKKKHGKPIGGNGPLKFHFTT